MKERETTARYMVMYKPAHGEWNPVNLFLIQIDHEPIYETKDKLIAIRVRDHMADCFKTHTYAIMELN